MHSIQETDAKETSGEKRIEWDIKEIEEIFRVLEMSLTSDNIVLPQDMHKGRSSRGTDCWVLF
jgi:hypothetical protein